MPIETICPGCQRKLRVGDEFAGKQARCPVCNEIYSVSGSAGGGAAASDAHSPSAGTWRLKTPEGQIYGPVSKQELDKWVSDGRVTANCFVAPDESNWGRADHVYPVLQDVPVATRSSVGAVANGDGITGAGTLPTATTPQAGAALPGGSSRQHAGATAGPTRYRYAAPHRGGLILALAVISWVVGCPIFGLFAWTMGSADLREMRLGRMDPSGMGLTQAGQIIGMIHSILVIVALVIAVFFLLLAVGIG